MAEPSPRVRFAAGSGGEDSKDEPSQDPSPPRPKFSSKKIGENLMREQYDRDPLFYYEVVSVLGVGSMGSVAKVRKRDAVIGGSARKALQEHFARDRRLQHCFQIPLLGGLFRFCMEKDSESIRSDDSTNLVSSARSLSSSILNTKNAKVEDYNDGHSEHSCDLIYAMKSIHLSRVTDPSFIEELKNEIQILRSLDHPHIVRPIEMFDHRNQLFIVMELCTGGDLYARDPYTEEEAARITSSILSAVAYLHSKNVTHRDLKYENILFVDNSPKAQIKLIDFGLSKVFGKEEMTEGVGTIYTMSPEVLKGAYSQEADVWSVGVIAYMLLSSQMPFYGRKRTLIVEQIMQGKYDFRGRRWKKISAQAKDFIQSLLIVNPDDRATAEEACRMSWLNKRFAATVRNPSAAELDSAHQSLIKFSRYSKLKQFALMVIAHKSTSAEIGILRKIFQQYDTEKDGALSFNEFKAAFDSLGYSEEDCKSMFEACDIDGSGKILYTEFLAATIEAHGAISEERLAEAFDRLDSDDSGYISAANLKELLGKDFPQEEIDSILSEVDIDKDGQISYSEFLALWYQQNESKREDMYNEMATAASDASSQSTSEATDLMSRANFIERKKSAEKRRSSIDLTDDERLDLFREITTVPPVIFGSEQVAVSERFEEPADILEEPRRISAAV